MEVKIKELKMKMEEEEVNMGDLDMERVEKMVIEVVMK
jgi:hypothetical protein